jgi:uncharacterized protein (TIGR02757 family)
MQALIKPGRIQADQRKELRQFLDGKVLEYNQTSFIAGDPICIPKKFSLKQDQEIAGFFAAVFSWGNRTTIIRKTSELLQLMDMAPYDFCRDPGRDGLRRISGFRHRTFNATDLLYFVEFLKFHFGRYDSLEPAFTKNMTGDDPHIEKALIGFHDYFFSLPDIPSRTRKHIASPAKKSTCKRLNMFLRWMVRKDAAGVDLGLWNSISPAQLICPVDLHVARVARRLGLLRRKQNDWQTALELTEQLRSLDPSDPVKYDFALFGLGIFEHY